jgi:hypothetical protein
MKDRRKPPSVKWTGKDRRKPVEEESSLTLDVILCFSIGLAIFSVFYKLLEW